VPRRRAATSVEGRERRWGSVARKGARVVRESRPEAQSRARQPAESRRPPQARPRPEPDHGIVAERTARAPGRRSPAARAEAPSPGEVLPAAVVEELAAAVGPERARSLAGRMEAAARAYAHDRYTDAFRMTKELVALVPESAAVRELHGLVCYRLGRWTLALGHLDAARRLDGDDASQLPVMMDCHRALHRHRRVAALWEELRAGSPSPDILAEGRMVLASDLADQGDLGAAVDVLASAGAGRSFRHPADRHLRQWYVLADLYDRAGDTAHARDLFGRVAAADPHLADAAARYEALGRRVRRPRPPARDRRRGDGRAAP